MMEVHMTITTIEMTRLSRGWLDGQIPLRENGLPWDVTHEWIKCANRK